MCIITLWFLIKTMELNNNTTRKRKKQGKRHSESANNKETIDFVRFNRSSFNLILSTCSKKINAFYHNITDISSVITSRYLSSDSVSFSKLNKSVQSTSAKNAKRVLYRCFCFSKVDRFLLSPPFTEQSDISANWEWIVRECVRSGWDPIYG